MLYPEPSQYQNTSLILLMLIKKDPRVFRQQLFCALVAEQNLVLEDINLHHHPPGLLPEESHFLKMIASISNGCKVIVTKGSTLLKFYAGIINNNEGVELHFDCGFSRGIAYYLEYLLLIAMTGKTTLNIHLHGLTNHPQDNSVDSIQNQLLPLLKNHYGLDNQLQMRIIKRGYLPQGGGHVHVVIPSVRRFPKVNLEEKGYVKRVRGTCAGSKISTSILNKVKDKVKARMLEYLPDVWVYSDYYKGDKASLSPGYSLSLQGQTTTGATITFDSCFSQGTPEGFADHAVDCFLDELEHSGMISTNYQWFLLTLMALSEKKTSSVKLGRISPFTVECLRVLRDTLGIVYEIQESQSQNMALFRCLGIGYQNYARIVK